MQYIISFLEGVITFISPCMLPMLPIYIMYFTGESTENNTKKTLINSIGFVLGFTIVFIVLGAFAGIIGRFLKEYQFFINIITGAIVIIFGLNFLGVFNIKLLNRSNSSSRKVEGFFSAILFGVVFSISWTPCVGAFLGSALMLASQQGSVFLGIIMLLFYSLGLGIPFVISAVLIDRLKGTFDFIKRNYTIITKISGVFLIIIGILMMTGLIGKFLALFTF